MPITSINPEKIKSVKYLINSIRQKHAEFENPKHALFIGAGCSFSSGIPLGSGIVEICKQLSFLENMTIGGKSIIKEFNKTKDYNKLAQSINNKYKKKFNDYVKDLEEQLLKSVRENRANEELKLKEYCPHANWSPDYESKIVADKMYGYWMNAYNEDVRVRQKLIEGLIEYKEPAGDYILLSYLIANDFFKNILTTNFDDFVQQSLNIYTEAPYNFYVDDELSQYISLFATKANIVKLHGDYRFGNLKNTNEETSRLTQNQEKKFTDLLDVFGLVVIGYNGADHSIMNSLIRAKRNSTNSLIWCGMDSSNVHWRVAELINNTKNSFFVQIDGFNKLMVDLYIHLCKGSEPCDLIRRAEIRQQKVTALLKEIRNDFEESSATQIDKEKFNKVVQVQDLLRKASEEKNIDEKIRIYGKVLELDKQSLAAYNNRGIYWVNKKEYDNAIADYTCAIQIAPDSVVYYNRGNVWDDKGEFNRAIKDYNEAIKLNSKNIDAYYNRGKSRQNNKEYTNALADYEICILMDPQDPYPYNGVVDVLREKGELELALGKAKEAINKFPQFGPLYGTLAEIYGELGNARAFYKNLEIAILLGYPVKDYLDMAVYVRYSKRPAFIKILEKSKNL